MESITNGYFSQYLSNTFTFASTLVFKMNDAALLANEGVALSYGLDSVDIEDPTSWKYYMNLSGEYHPTDTVMRVISIDTLEEIEFTKENLEIHTATKEAYQFGSRQYYALLNQYPKQQRLINGILYPVNKEEAILAEDGKILFFQKDLVETNEISLIEDLEKYIKTVNSRWYNTQFNMSNELYLSCYLSQLYSAILNKLLNLRIERCHTPEVHSFHVRMYLASHGELDRYLPYMTLEQSLWLYRNIRYIERNAGLTNQFYTLIDKLLTKRGIPLGEYTIRQKDSFNNYLPYPSARMNFLNQEANLLTDDSQELSILFEKEISLAPNNKIYLDQYQKQDELAFALSPSNTVQTKALISSMVDYSNAIPQPFESIALAQWCMMANSGYYESYISFKDPKSSIVYNLAAKDAFIYLYYVTLQRQGIDVVEIPRYLNMRQRKHPKPSIAQLMEVVDQENYDLYEVAKDIYVNQPVIQPCFSVSAFNRLVNQLYSESYRHWFIVSGTQEYYERAMVQNMIDQLYEDKLTVFSETTGTFADWLSELNLPTYDYSQEEAASLIKAIYEAGSGFHLDETKQLKNIQSAMIGLMTQLSSYSIQFIKEINTSDLIIVNWPAVRLGNIKTSQQITRHVNNGVIVLETKESSEAFAFIGTGNESNVNVKEALTEGTISVQLDPVLDTNMQLDFEYLVTDLGSQTLTDITYEGQDTELDGSVGLPGFTTFETLSLIQKQKLKSIYN